MDNRPLNAFERLEGFTDQMLTRLGQDLNRDVIGYQIVLYQLTRKIKLRLCRRWKANFNLLKAQLHQ